MRATANEPPAEPAEPETQGGVEATEDRADDAFDKEEGHYMSRLAMRKEDAPVIAPT
jgi:hypothetical protein